MRKIINLALPLFYLFAIICIFGSIYYFYNEKANRCTIYFDSNGGNNVETQSLNCGSKILNYPTAKKEGYLFQGWYLEDAEFDFDTTIEQNLTLKAKWIKQDLDQNYIPVKKINLTTKTLTIKRPEVIKLDVVIEPSNATNKKIFWSSSNEKIATIDKDGIITAKKSGKVIIIATSDDNGYKDKLTLIVTSPVTGIKVYQNNIKLNINDSINLKANTVPENADNNKIIWTSSNEKIATVDEKGKVKGISNGKTNIIATTEEGNFQAIIELSIQTLVKKITLNKTNLSLEKGQNYDLNYSITPKNATEKNVIWTSNNDKVVTVDNNGRVTAIGGGEATITAKSVDGKASATCKVNVISNVTGITLSQNKMTIGKGDTKNLKATILPTDATNKEIVWSSSNSKIVKVNNSGKITAISDGSAIITATTKDGNYKATCTVIVKDLVLKIKLDKTSASIEKNSTYKIKYEVQPATATNKNVTWSSSNTSVATVDQTGKVTAKAPGTTDIYVSSNDGNASSKFTLNVVVSLKGISINKSELTLQKKSTYTLAITYNPADATNKNVIWTSSNNAVATVDKNGKITAVGVGTSNITVTTKDGNYKATCKVTVTNLVTNINLNKSMTQLQSKEKEKLTYNIVPSDATNKTVTWTSSNTSVATVDQSGNITAVSPGVATITARTSNNKSATCTIYVTSIDINQGSATIMDEATYKLSYNLKGTVGNEKVIWTSSNTSVATVDSNGNVTGKNIGSSKITAKITTLNNKTITSNSFTIKVRARKIILVGNSKTYQSYLARYVALMAKADGYSLEGITYNNYTDNALSSYPAEDSSNNITYFRDTGGKKLSETFKIHKKELNQSFDYVVIQEATSNYSSTDYSDYYQGAKNILNMVYTKNPNIKMFIRKTWVLSDSNSKTKKQAYNNTEAVVKDLKNNFGYNLNIINDGPSMYYALSKNYDVMKTDKRHQTTLGAYLAASCIYSKLFGKDPTTIKYKPTKIDQTSADKMEQIAKSYCYNN